VDYEVIAKSMKIEPRLGRQGLLESLASHHGAVLYLSLR